MARVEITTAGHSIVVDSDGLLDEVAGKALYLWERTRDPRIDRAFAPGFAPVLDRPEGGPTYVTPFDVDMHHPSDTKAGGDDARHS
ncbi:hypothetical protein C1I95_28180 [Micromonospora craterilacus]|uniref:Uncharacterized protein n=1 Tax=Micromonospora craterilacus TaxID=1655439 RepID=A0A2W2DEI6_9ACTN|nr:hypothetical protein [Micromonospora craterilacus]PZG10302.1 hypothetical protein C1I95_28180 [Micromonospora craterilacus]